MTKSITLGTIAFAFILFLTLSFTSADNEKKDYVTIYYNDLNKIITISYSNGTFKNPEFQKQQGAGDQSQVLKLINEHETLGYKLINYNNNNIGASDKQGTSVLLAK